MKKPEKFIIILLVFLVFISSFAIVPVSAARYEAEAALLHALGIIDGWYTEPFDAKPGAKLQRQAAVVALVKLFGKKDEVHALTQSEVDGILSRYSDSHLIAPSARPYIAYAVKTGMAAGTSPGTLSPRAWMDSDTFAAMILRNMGYGTDSPEVLLRPMAFLGEISGLDERAVTILSKKVLIKDDAVGILYAALQARLPDRRHLMEDLIGKGYISAITAAKYGFILSDPASGTGMRLPGYAYRPSDREVVYELIRDALLSVSESIMLPVNTASDTPEEVFAVWQDVLNDTPEILYNTGLIYRSDGLLTFDYSLDIEIVKKHRRLLEERAEALLRELIRPGMTDFQKELVIHDYIVNYCTYDPTPSKSPEANSAYGVLCLGKAVCEGYAKAIKLLLDRAGVECLLVTGQALNSFTGTYQSHAWNIVKIEGKYYHLDATWDDPIMKDGSNKLIHTYFNLPDEDIGRDHRWDRTSYPVCVSTEHNYYVYNDLIAIGYDAFVSYASRKAREGHDSIAVKISPNQEIGFDLNKAFKEIQSRANRRICAYKPVDSYGIIELFFK